MEFSEPFSFFLYGRSCLFVPALSFLSAGLETESNLATTGWIGDGVAKKATLFIGRIAADGCGEKRMDGTLVTRLLIRLYLSCLSSLSLWSHRLASCCHQFRLLANYPRLIKHMNESCPTPAWILTASDLALISRKQAGEKGTSRTIQQFVNTYVISLAIFLPST